LNSDVVPVDFAISSPSITIAFEKAGEKKVVDSFVERA
jgi:hypothetical protein